MLAWCLVLLHLSRWKLSTATPMSSSHAWIVVVLSQGVVMSCPQEKAGDLGKITAADLGSLASQDQALAKDIVDFPFSVKKRCPPSLILFISSFSSAYLFGRSVLCLLFLLPATALHDGACIKKCCSPCIFACSTFAYCAVSKTHRLLEE